MGMMIYHLFDSLISRTSKPSRSEKNMQDILQSSDFSSEWEYIFAVKLCSQYSCEVWFPCLVKLLQEIQMHSERDDLLSVLHMAMQFILLKLEDTELFFQFESGKNPDYLQVSFTFQGCLCFFLIECTLISFPSFFSYITMVFLFEECT